MIRSVYYIEHPEVGYIERPLDTHREPGAVFKFTKEEINRMYPEPETNQKKIYFFSNNKFKVAKVETWSDPNWQGGRELRYYWIEVTQ